MKKNSPIQRKPVIHFWVPYPQGQAPSQRFRVELFLPAMIENGFQYKILSFLDQRAWDVLYSEGKGLLKLFGTLIGFFRRFIHLLQSVKADYVFLHREAAPLGPPLYEWILAKVLGKKIIHEYDDAIWIPGGEPISWFKKWLKAAWKVKYIIRWSYKIAAGNQFLCDYAKQYNKNVYLIPTVVDTQKGHYLTRNQDDSERVVVGWTGSHTTLHNLELIEHLIPELKKEIDFDFLIISNKPPVWTFDFLYKKWEAASEQDDLLNMHIGIMPLKKGLWFEGKCGFKLIQYHACGIPAIASPVGVNGQITLHGQTGFLASNDHEWKIYLARLIQEKSLRIKMGNAGREHIRENFSLNKVLPVFISLFS